MMQAPAVRAAIAAMGHSLTPETLAASRALFADAQNAVAERIKPAASDLAYGQDPRQRLDIYGGAPGAGLPVLVWVHGGGFLRGAKRDDAHPFEAHIGRFAARNGMVGVVLNYRLAPLAQWPSGGEDIALALAWLRANIAAYGGDPARIVVMGTSAGACHIATCLRLQPRLPIRAAVLLSGLYGYTPLDERDRAYFGAGEAAFCDVEQFDAVLRGPMPLFAACTEFDPPRFQAEALALWRRVHDLRGALPRGGVVSGHNHYSISLHIGGPDTRLSDEILGFIAENCAE